MGLLRLVGTLLLLLGTGGPAPPSSSPAPRPWAVLWQAGEQVVWQDAAPPAWVARTWRDPGVRSYRFCGEVQGYGALTLVVGTEGDPVWVDSQGPYWLPVCLVTTIPAGQASVPLDVALYLWSATADPLYFRPGTLFVSDRP